MPAPTRGEVAASRPFVAFTTLRATWTDTAEFVSVVVQLVVGEDFVIRRLKAAIEANNYATPANLAALKVICEIVIMFIQHGHFLDEIQQEKIIDALSEASSTMSGLETCMLFAGLDKDCHGIPVKPLSCALVEQTREVFKRT